MKKSGRVKNSQNLDNRQNRFIDSSLKPSVCLVFLGNSSNHFACNDLLAAFEELYSQSQVAWSFILLGCDFPVNFDDDDMMVVIMMMVVVLIASCESCRCWCCHEIARHKSQAESN